MATEKKTNPLLRYKRTADTMRMPEGPEKEAIMGAAGTAKRHQWAMGASRKYSKEQADLGAHAKKYGEGEWGKMESGYTHNARGEKVPLYRQGKVTRKEFEPDDPSAGEGDPLYEKPFKYEVEFDKSWDDYNKTLSEMRHRVQFGVRNRRSAELQSKGGKFGPGQAQRQAASVKAGQKRAGTLISGQFDD